jgi:hypothetical protein
MKQAIYGVKTVFGTGLGFASASLFVSTMDDLVYSNFKKNVIMPF